jgi:hypothetical protein
MASFHKVDYFLQLGEKQSDMGFVCEGLIRRYYINEKENEITTGFTKELEYVTELSIQDKIQQRTNQIFDSLVKTRRDFHAYPELAGQEIKTSKKIAEYLNALGLEVHTNIGGFGVVGILRTIQKGKRIAWRADIDALKSKHTERHDFSSKNKGVRHICGHDVHTTIALGIANVLSSIKDRLSGSIYFIFQPAEENLSGAKRMINAGLFNLISPDEIYALQMAPMPEGIIATKANNIYADYKHLQITFKNTSKREAPINYLKTLILNFQNVESDSRFWDNRNLLDPNIGLGNPNTIFNPDYVIEFVMSVAIAKKIRLFGDFSIAPLW